ncbi:thiolase family protein [Nocardia zapadnayensis]|uniref:thiolase family protein n=1 Tax=Nocardia rhamnosiphila TaxID=426716 RepID=UPI002246AA07|nr:thiolase family protein [Nocardia zapadnayensis]MCX0272795.1 thiolase family protein [Nocardia zapadnayensis]
MTALKDTVAISGIGRSPYARDRGTTELSMVTDAVIEAIRDSGLPREAIDGVVGSGVMTGGVDTATVVSALGLPNVTFWASAKPPIVNGLMSAVHAVAAGTCRAVVVYHSMYRLGAGKFRERAAFGLPDGRASTGDGHTDSEPWGMFGSTGYAAWASRYLTEFGRSREDLSLIPLNGRRNAADNPGAVMRTPMSREDYFGARMIREPLCLYDMDVPIDGADAFVITAADLAADLPTVPVLVHALAMGMTAHPEEHLTADLRDTGQQATAAALRARSDLWIDDVDVFLPYDGFSIITLRAFESYGFCADGEAGDFLRDNWDTGEGRILLRGRVPVNPHGGSLSEGGSQGAGHLREAVVQLRGDAGNRQVDGAASAMLTPGGFFFNAQGVVLRREAPLPG